MYIYTCVHTCDHSDGVPGLLFKACFIAFVRIRIALAATESWDTFHPVRGTGTHTYICICSICSSLTCTYTWYVYQSCRYVRNRNASSMLHAHASRTLWFGLCTTASASTSITNHHHHQPGQERQEGIHPSCFLTRSLTHSHLSCLVSRQNLSHLLLT